MPLSAPRGKPAWRLAPSINTIQFLMGTSLESVCSGHNTATGGIKLYEGGLDTVVAQFTHEVACLKGVVCGHDQLEAIFDDVVSQDIEDRGCMDEIMVLGWVIQQ